MYDLRCNAGGDRPIKVSNKEGTVIYVYQRNTTRRTAAQKITTRRRSPDIQALPTTLLPSMLSLSGPNDNNAQAQSRHHGTAYNRHDAVDGAPRLTVHALNKDERHGKHKINTTKINRNQIPDTGIEPETSDMPGKRATFTPPGHLCFLMHYPTISTHR